MNTNTTIDTKKEYKIGYDDEIKADANEIGANEIGANEIGANEIGANEIGVNEIGANEIKVNEFGKNPATCIYDEICNRAKMCGDCAADEFESERNEEVWKNFKIDRKIALRGGYNSD
jgi:hypothetical protein